MEQLQAVQAAEAVWQAVYRYAVVDILVLQAAQAADATWQCLS